MTCFIKSHKTHDCSDVAEVSVDLRKQVKSDTDKVAEILRKIDEVLPGFELEKNDLINNLADIENEISNAADKLIAVVQCDRVRLLSEVESIKLKRTKQLAAVKQDVEQHTIALKSLKQYSETLFSTGTACDVVRSASNLHETANELMMFDVIGHIDSSVPPLNVTFTLSTVPEVLEMGNIIGNVSEESMFHCGFKKLQSH